MGVSGFIYFLTRKCRDKIDLNGNVPKCLLFSVTVLLRAQMYLLDFNVWPLEILYFKRNQIRSKLKPVQLSNDEVSLTGMVNCVLLPNSAYSYHESASLNTLKACYALGVHAVQPRRSACWFHHWLMLCTLDLCIVNVHCWLRNSDGFLTIFTSGKLIGQECA